MQPIGGDFGAMNNINALLNQHQISSLHDLHGHGQMLAASQFDPAAASHDDFLDQMLSSVPSSAFHWGDDNSPPEMEEHSTAALESKLRQHQISGGAAKALMLQQQLMLSRSIAAANGGLRSPTGGDGALIPMPLGDHNDVVDGNSFKSASAVSYFLPFFFHSLRRNRSFLLDMLLTAD